MVRVIRAPQQIVYAYDATVSYTQGVFLEAKEYVAVEIVAWQRSLFQPVRPGNPNAPLGIIVVQSVQEVRAQDNSISTEPACSLG